MVGRLKQIFTEILAIEGPQLDLKIGFVFFVFGDDLLAY